LEEVFLIVPEKTSTFPFDIILGKFFCYKYFSIIISEILIPSTAEDTIPPAYPAPSPIGYIPPILEVNVSLFLIILSGAELLLSIPVNTHHYL
jgi:hypothetical protein